jgi:hypothetical protein
MNGEAAGEYRCASRRSCGAPFEIRAQGDFGIGVGGEGMPTLDQGATQLAIAVDLTVEYDPARTIRHQHRLVGGWAEVDNREATKPDVHRTVEQQLARVRPAVRDRGKCGRVVPRRISSANEATHRCFPCLAGRCRVFGTNGS